jgi:hypothetical protein
MTTNLEPTGLPSDKPGVGRKKQNRPATSQRECRRDMIHRAAPIKKKVAGPADDPGETRTASRAKTLARRRKAKQYPWLRGALMAPSA